MPRVNLLIADDVGLGKTIESGLVALELIIRHRARRVLVVCPASLQVQWRDQMRDKFGLDFRIVDSELMRDLRRRRGIHVNPWSHFPRLITSIDFLKRERPLRLFKETLPAEGESIYPRRYDVLIVDEAHNCAPAGRGKYATDSLRTGAIRLLAPHFEHKLFLTATPHNGYSRELHGPPGTAGQPAVRPGHGHRNQGVPPPEGCGDGPPPEVRTPQGRLRAGPVPQEGPGGPRGRLPRRGEANPRRPEAVRRTSAGTPRTTPRSSPPTSC